MPDVKTIRGFLRNWDLPPSLDNLDWDTALLLKRRDRDKQEWEFGAYDFREGSVEIKLFDDSEDPNLKDPHYCETDEDWQIKKLEWIKKGQCSWRLFKEGIAEGYISYSEHNPDSDEFLLVTNCADEYLDEYFFGTKEEQWDDMCVDREESIPEARRERKRKLGRMFGRKIPSQNALEEAREQGTIWQLYVQAKTRYANSARTPGEYDARIKDIVSKLGI
ncbi:hypothetical protein FJZ17_04095 [Candidatus Pacearchaeota archaeon]|nr:hypothetical protein [Candidatus Pacearchaeota archaeon]